MVFDEALTDKAVYPHPILLVDDDPKIIKLLQANLEARGYSVLIARDGTEALQKINEHPLRLVILDIMMPGLDGREVCRYTRDRSSVPIVILSALHEVDTKIHCLDLGADDYITKPFTIDEFLARIRAVIRRNYRNNSTAKQPSTLTKGDVLIDFDKRIVVVAGCEIYLTPKEYDLLKELAMNAGRVLPHIYLLNKIWGSEYGGEKEYLRVYISRLRAKIEPDPANPRYITTHPGIGYLFQSKD